MLKLTMVTPNTTTTAKATYAPSIVKNWADRLVCKLFSLVSRKQSSYAAMQAIYARK
jgi:hypothetical protein